MGANWFAWITPDCLHFISPFLKMIKVGTDCTLYAAAACGFLSISTFIILALSLTCEATSFNMGAIILHGPHHSAEKSTRTGTPELIRSVNFDMFIKKIPHGFPHLVFSSVSCAFCNNLFIGKFLFLQKIIVKFVVSC